MLQGDTLKKTRPSYYLLVGGVFLIIDQFLKFLARTHTNYSYYLYKPWVGWEYFENTGIAFGLNIPTWFLIIITPIILVLFVHLFLEKSFLAKTGILSLLLPGAISNFIDRILFGVTIDYLRFFTTLFNIADVLIISGILILIFHYLNKEEG
ncbi:MAG: signal peptidase II [Candidatus Magasanikbacteria bacterium]